MAVGNKFIIRLSDNTMDTYYRVDQTYGDLADLAEARRSKNHSSLTVDFYALAKDDEVETQAVGRDLDTDFDILEKQNVPGTKTMIPPDGMVEGDLIATDEVVCYTT